MSDGDLVESVREVEGEPGECGDGWPTDGDGQRMELSVRSAARTLRRRRMGRKLLRGEQEVIP